MYNAIKNHQCDFAEARKYDCNTELFMTEFDFEARKGLSLLEVGHALSE